MNRLRRRIQKESASIRCSGVVLIVAYAAALHTARAAGHAGQNPEPTVWNRIYTEAQAARGRIAYVQHCGRCHGEQSANPQNPLWGEQFAEHWESRTLADLFRRIRDTMPPGGAAPMIDAGDKLDAMAFVLQQNGFPEGNVPLRTDEDALAAILITGRSGPIAIRTGTVVAVTGCLSRRGDREWQLTSATGPVRARLGPQPPAMTPDQPVSAIGGAETVILLNPYPNPAAHTGHRMRATGFLVRNGDGDAVNVVSLEMIAATCSP